MHRYVLTVIAALFFWCFAAPHASALIFVQVQGLSDFSLPAWSLGDPSISANISLCVYSTVSSTYSVTVASAGGFKLANGSNSINYSLTWDDGGTGNLGNTSGNALTNNVALSGLRNANAISPACLSGPNARLNLKITQADMTAALAGNYTGAVTIMISPN